VIVIVLSGHAAYALFGDGIRLVDLGLASVVAVAQVMPALTGVLFWPRATARGAAAGLAAGIIAWIATPVVPLLADAGVLPRAWSWLAQLGVSDDPWTFTTALTLGVNTCAFVVASLWREASQDERDAAQICMRRSNPPLGDVVGAGSAGEFENRLSHALGKDAAAQELDRALAQLGLLRDARRPEELLALREQLEKNLSGLLGPVKARRIVDEQLALRRSLREMQAMAEHQNRLAVIGRFAAGVAHEIGNPIIAIASIAHDLKTMIERAEPRRALDQLLGEAKRIERIIRSLVAFAHDGQMTVAMQPTVIEAAHLVDEAVTVARLGRASRNVSVETHIQPDLIMRGDRQRLEQVLINLITNACDASEDGAVVQIHARACDASVQFRVVDRGVGMTKEVRDLAFEPFFTTKPPGAGTGLGLPLAYGIVAEHGGSIAIESQPGGGTTVIVELPI
jgi:signal transduction histidine kinase